MTAPGYGSGRLRLTGRRVLVQRLAVPAVTPSGLYLADFAQTASIIADAKAAASNYDGPDYGGIELPTLGRVLACSARCRDAVAVGNLVAFPRWLDLRRVRLSGEYVGLEPDRLHDLLLFEEDEVYAEVVRER